MPKTTDTAKRDYPPGFTPRLRMGRRLVGWGFAHFQRAAIGLLI
jgi:hypothetical protein